jgi:hypothetical protein
VESETECPKERVALLTAGGVKGWTCCQDYRGFAVHLAPKFECPVFFIFLIADSRNSGVRPPPSSVRLDARVSVHTCTLD